MPDAYRREIPEWKDPRPTMVVYESDAEGNCEADGCGFFRPLFVEEHTGKRVCTECLITRSPYPLRWWVLSLTLESEHGMRENKT